MYLPQYDPFVSSNKHFIPQTSICFVLMNEKFYFKEFKKKKKKKKESKQFNTSDNLSHLIIRGKKNQIQPRNTPTWNIRPYSEHCCRNCYYQTQLYSWSPSILASQCCAQI